MTDLTPTGGVLLGLLLLLVCTAMVIGVTETARWRRGETLITKAQAGLRIVTGVVLLLLFLCFLVGAQTEGWLKLLFFSTAILLALLLVPIALLDIQEVRKKLREKQKELLQDLASSLPATGAASDQNGRRR